VETGRVVAEGSADEIRGSEVLERVYLGSHVSG
jgi:ABC-type lipopolysaccharide export system ATPase subunit